LLDRNIAQLAIAFPPFQLRTAFIELEVCKIRVIGDGRDGVEKILDY